MAQNSDFSLPPQFLTDDEKRFVNSLFTTSKNDDVFNNAFSSTLFPHFSDKNDYINELTRRMAHSTLQHKLALNNKGIFVNGSFGNCINQNDAGLKMNSRREAYDLLHAAAGEVDKAHHVNNDEAFYNFLPKKPSVFNSQDHQHSISLHKQLQIQRAQFEMLKKRWLSLKQREELARGCGGFLQKRSVNYQNVLRGTSNETVFQGNVGLSPSAWPSVQKIGNNNKAGFPGNPNLKKERNGTGVFLPRFFNTEPSRKKPAVKNVVVPERVVHALNQKVDEGMIRGYMQQKNRFNEASNFDYGVARNESDDGFFRQKRNVKAQQREVNSEIMLPQEWTY